MDWRVAVLAGAVGGAVVEWVAFLADLNAFRQARKDARGRRRKLPSWRQYFDPWPDVAAGLTRMALGAVGGGLLHSQVTTALAAVAVGAAAPALFGQFGAARSMREITAQVEGGPE